MSESQIPPLPLFMRAGDQAMFRVQVSPERKRTIAVGEHEETEFRPMTMTLTPIGPRAREFRQEVFIEVGTVDHDVE